MTIFCFAQVLFYDTKTWLLTQIKLNVFKKHNNLIAKTGLNDKKDFLFGLKFEGFYLNQKIKK